MSHPIQDPAVVLVAALIAEDRATKAKLALAEATLRAVTWERDELARQVTDMVAKVLRQDVELIDAGGQMQDQDNRIAELTRALTEWEDAADTLGPVGRPVGDQP